MIDLVLVLSELTEFRIVRVGEGVAIELREEGTSHDFRIVGTPADFERLATAAVTARNELTEAGETVPTVQTTVGTTGNVTVSFRHESIADAVIPHEDEGEGEG